MRKQFNSPVRKKIGVAWVYKMEMRNHEDASFEEGDLVLVFSKKNQWMFTLEKGQQWDTHLGSLDHDSIIGSKSGKTIQLKRQEVRVTKPTLIDYIDMMEKTTQIIYPKDLATMVFHGDVHPGLKILELGTGSGALTLTLLRAVGRTGKIVSYDNKKRHVEKALENIRRFPLNIDYNTNLEVRIKDVYEGIDIDETFDRIFIDLPNATKVLPFLKEKIKSDGRIINYCVQANQLQEYVLALEKHGFIYKGSFETLKRDWIVDKLRLRPKERILGYGAFITLAIPS